MAIYNLGSINADYVYRVPHLPAPGETIAARDMTAGLGGKGCNMSVAAARAAARTVHIGAIGDADGWIIERLMEYGVDTRHIRRLTKTPTGHAIINVDDQGENAIVILPGANHALSESQIGLALSEASPGDTLLLQNETTNQNFAAETARALGLRIAYAAAPFDAIATQGMLDLTDILFLNAVEASQLEAATGKALNTLGVAHVIVTRGAAGVTYFDTVSGEKKEYRAFPVMPVDTTGAGDTFTGYTIAALDRGLPMPQAITLASRAAALMVTRVGTADVIPDLKDVQDARF